MAGIDRPAANDDDIWRVVEHVDGWLTRAQVDRLAAAARSVVVGGTIVEIGSYRGRSAIVLAHAAPSRIIYAIDPHHGDDRGPQEWDGDPRDGQSDNEIFERNLAAAGVRQSVRHLRQMSDAARPSVTDPIDLLFVDGSHRFARARDDIRRWGSGVTPNGTLLIHDSFSSIGVTFAILTTMLGSSRWVYVGRSTSMAEFRRSPVAVPLRTRARSAATLVMLLGVFARNLVVKALIAAHLGRVTKVLGHDGVTWPH